MIYKMVFLDHPHGPKVLKQLELLRRPGWIELLRRPDKEWALQQLWASRELAVARTLLAAATITAVMVHLTSLSNLTFPSPQNSHLARTVDLTLNCAFVYYSYTCLIRMVEQCWVFCVCEDTFSLEKSVGSNNYKAWQADGYHGGRDLDRTEGKLPYCATT